MSLLILGEVSPKMARCISPKSDERGIIPLVNGKLAQTAVKPVPFLGMMIF
jgi:hypothetical protein